MADNSTGLPVKSLATETVRARLVDTGGTNEAAISAAGRISVDGSGVTQPISGTVAIGTSVVPGTGATNLGKAEDAVAADGDTGVMVLAVRRDAASSGVTADGDYAALSVDSSGALRVTGGSGGTQYAGDAAATATPTGTVSMGLANAAAPTDVSANNDAVAQWMLRNGSAVVNLASGGTLITIGQKAMAASVPVVIASDQGSFPVTVSGGATAANQTNVQVVDNAGFTDGTTTVGMAGYIFDDVAGTALTENDAAAARIDSKRAQVFVGEDATTRGQKWAISAAGALKVDGSAVTQPVSGTVSITANSAVNVAQIGGTNTVTGGVAGSQGVGGVVAHDAVGTSVNPTLVGGYASAAAPTDVSADGDSTRIWTLRNGSQVVNLASGGTLVTVGQKAMASSVPVVISSDQSNLPSNIVQIGGSAPGATAFLPTRLTDGTAYYSNTGQTAATAPFTRITDATNTAAVIATINALKEDISSIAGAVPSATNALPVRLTDGSSFYASASAAPASPQVSTVTSSALGAGASVDLDHTLITNGTTGRLDGVDVASTVPLKVEIKTVNGSNVATTRVVLFAPTYSGIQWRSPFKTYITQAGAAASARFRVTVTNKDNATAADVYSTAYWDQV